MLRHPDDKPSIGLILCRARSGIIAAYALRDIGNPPGISESRHFEKRPDHAANHRGDRGRIQNAGGPAKTKGEDKCDVAANRTKVLPVSAVDIFRRRRYSRCQHVLATDLRYQWPTWEIQQVLYGIASVRRCVKCILWAPRQVRATSPKREDLRLTLCRSAHSQHTLPLPNAGSLGTCRLATYPPVSLQGGGMAERSPEKAGGDGSIPFLATMESRAATNTKADSPCPPRR